MASNDLVIGQSPDVGHNLFIGLGHSHDVGLVFSRHHHHHHHHHHQRDHYDRETDRRNELSMLQELGGLTVSPPGVQPRPLIVSPDYELKVGQEFSDVISCRRALRNAAIACNFEIQTVKSDKTRFTAKCAAEGCPWRVHAAKLPGLPTFSIRTIKEAHTCGGIVHLGHHQASVQWVADSVEKLLRENPNYKPKEILEEIHRTHGITLSYKQAWRGKERVLATVRGPFEEEHRLLWQYCQQITRTNPGSIALVYADPEDNCFQRLFIAFHASIYGFIHGCRPLIGLERVALKSKYLGSLFVATGFDGNGGSFPLAFAVVDEETDENWVWFLSELRVLLESNSENMPMLTILSDRHQGIIDGLEINFPTAFHGFCIRHLCERFRKEFDDAMLANLFWEAALALTVPEFQVKMEQINEISHEAAYWINGIPSRLWATAYFEGSRFGRLSANAEEPLSTRIAEASGLPIIQMMESIRRQLMTWFNERREESIKWMTILVPSAEQQVSIALQCARSYQVVRANEMELQVVSPLDDTIYIVDIRNRCCCCRAWQLYGLPCSHGVAALLSCGQNVQKYGENCFTVAMYRKTYSQSIHPIPDKSLWKELSVGTPDGNDQSQIVVNPPRRLKPPERPKKRRVHRRDDRGYVKRIVRCSRCNQTGHFRTTCAAPT